MKKKTTRYLKKITFLQVLCSYAQCTCEEKKFKDLTTNVFDKEVVQSYHAPFKIKNAFNKSKLGIGIKKVKYSV